MEKQVVWLAGLPNAAKSTLRNKEYSDFVVISFDDLIMEYFDAPIYDEAYRQYAESSDETKKVIEQINIIKFLKALLRGENVVLDFVNLSEAFIQKYYELVPDTYRKEYVLLDTSFGTILERNRGRIGKFIPPQVLESMQTLLENAEWERFAWDNIDIRTLAPLK